MSDDQPKAGDLVLVYTEDENEDPIETVIESFVRELENDAFAVMVDGEEITVEWDEDYNAWHEAE